MSRVHRAIAVVATLAAIAPPASAEVLWDNGLAFWQGLSNRSGEGQRRSILDDFEVAHPAWSVTRLHLKGWQAGLFWGNVEALELTFYRDRDGTPDFDQLVAVAGNIATTELRDPNQNFFDRIVVDVRAEFDAIQLPEGRYWVDMHVVVPHRWFQAVSDTIHGSPLWVDYEDFGGRQPGRNLLGADYDVNFVLEGEVIPAPPIAMMLAVGGACAARGRRRQHEVRPG